MHIPKNLSPNFWAEEMEEGRAGDNSVEDMLLSSPLVKSKRYKKGRWDGKEGKKKWHEIRTAELQKEKEQ